ncbi:hypothetical protein [Flavivirga algicola]|uniref:Uncharacterized protein n=1 Tax=Flavivirga algicola TaxID=2729136 RepID=A0ABX1RWX5_9FLAO|nr:hypothetical protein [Flavivirga algicola]NMH86964.1 hypothetical protein [Flavivirga algicola]
MEQHFQLTDVEFNEQFTNCSLNPELFSHEAHLRLGWINIKNLGLKKGEENIQKQLQNFVIHVGAHDKYNKTVTIVAMKILNHFMQQSKTDNFKDFINENSKLKDNFKQLIANHYSNDIFKSEKAKTVFLEPDLIPFD